jgi:hypothetical protein
MTRLLGKFQPLDQGIKPDQPRNTRFWADSENVLFEEGGATPFPGQSLAFDKVGATQPVTGIVEGSEQLGAAQEEHTKVLYYGTLTQLFEYEDGGAVNDVSRAQSVANPLSDYSGINEPLIDQDVTIWSFAKWGNWTFATNGVEQIQLYRKNESSGTPEGETSFYDLDVQANGLGAPNPFPSTFRAEIVRTLGEFLVAYHTEGQGGQTYAWCDQDDPLSWDYTNLASAAGFLTIRNLGSPIIAVEPLGDGHAVYGGDKMFLVRQIGAPLWFGHDELLSGIGAFGKNCVAVVGRTHYGFGPRGIWVTDGVQYQYIDDEAVRDYIYQNMDRSKASKFAAIHNPATKTVQFFWEDLDGTFRGIAYSYLAQSWNNLGYHRRCGTAGSVFENSFFCDSAGNVYIQSNEAFSAPAADGEPVNIAAYVHYVDTFKYGNSGYGYGFYGGERIRYDPSVE